MLKKKQTLQIWKKYSILFLILIVSIISVNAVIDYLYYNTVLNDVTYMQFNNDSTYGENDTLVYDFSGIGNNGTVSGGALWNSSGGYYGDGAFEFDGVNGLITISGATSNSLFESLSTTSYTFSLWTKIENAVTSNVAGDAQAIIGTSTKPYIYLKLRNSQYQLRYIDDNDDKTASTSQTAGEWVHLVGVFDVPNKKVKLYKNGNLVSTQTLSNEFEDLNSSSFYLGRTDSSYFNGTLDEFIVWDEAKSDDEIFNIHNQYIKNATLTITELDVVNGQSSTAYGTNHIYWFAKTETIHPTNDTNADSNMTWHQENYIYSNMKYLRNGMSLQSYYDNDSDGTPVYEDGSINRTNDLSWQKNITKWAYENNIKILWTADYMPTWLADNSSGYCDNLIRCTASNFTLFGDLVVNFIDTVTENGLYASAIEIEVWNEPDYFLLNELTANDPIKSVEYNKIYNATYDAVKSAYPNMLVGGPSIASNSSYVILNNFLGNFSNKMDFLTSHEYWWPDAVNPHYDEQLNIHAQWYQSLCGNYNANCSRIIFSEWNIGPTIGVFGENGTQIKHEASNESLYRQEVALAYMSALKNNVTMVNYQWSEHYKLEYPAFWEHYYGGVTISEPDIDNKYYPMFNVTYWFTRLCPEGSQILNGDSYNSYIKSIGCVDGNVTNFIVVNTWDENITLTLNLSSNLTNLNNYKTGDAINYNSILTIQPNEVLYLGNAINKSHREYSWILPSIDIIVEDNPSYTKFTNIYFSSLQLNISNLTNPFIYFSNGSVIQSNGDINISLTSNEYCEVYDNWNKIINTNLNRTYISNINSDVITFSGTGTAYFTNSLSSNKIILNSGARISFLDGGKLT